jgi:hypothetical protein
LRESSRKVDGGGRFADPSLLVGYGYDRFQ